MFSAVAVPGSSACDTTLLWGRGPSRYTAYGMAYGLLQHDMIERFLLHYFGMSAHTYTRATWTTPEAAHPDRDVGSTDYVAAGVRASHPHIAQPLHPTCHVHPPRPWGQPRDTLCVRRTFSSSRVCFLARLPSCLPRQKCVLTGLRYGVSVDAHGICLHPPFPFPLRFWWVGRAGPHCADIHEVDAAV